MSAEARWADDSYAQLEDVLRRRAGLVFQTLRRPTVEAAAVRVMRRIGVAKPDTFVTLTAQDGAVFDDLMAEVTIGETYFFRESGHFDLLRGEILPGFRRMHGDERPFRAWSAGCSTGEEPYSLAIVLREAGLPFDVVGTDVSRARLAAARRGEYRRWSFRGVPETTIERYFRRTAEDTFVLSPDVRRDVDFRYLNLKSDCYPSMPSGVWGMDFIFCRNVLIYFDRDTIAYVAASMMATLAEGGWIILGATDPPLNEYVACTVVQTQSGLAYRRPGAVASRRPPHPPARVTPVPAPPPLPPPATPKPAAPKPEPVATSGITRAMDAAVTAPVVASARDAYAKRDYERAIDIVAPLAASRRATPDDLVVYIRALANVGRLDDAGRVCALALDQFRDNAELHYLHAILVAQSGHHAESARAAKRALYLDRDMTVGHLALGNALLRAGDTAGARRAFGAAERTLRALPVDAVVPFSDNEPAGRLLEMTRVQSRLARGDAA